MLVLALLAVAAGCARGNKTATTASGQVVTGDKAAAIDRLRDAGADLQQLMNAPDAAVPDEVLKAAKCVEPYRTAEGRKSGRIRLPSRCA